MAAYEKSVFITSKYLLCPIAVMYVEIDYRYSLNVMVISGMQSTDRNVVKNAKSHGAAGLCVMSRRACEAESFA